MAKLRFRCSNFAAGVNALSLSVRIMIFNMSYITAQTNLCFKTDLSEWRSITCIAKEYDVSVCCHNGERDFTGKASYLFRNVVEF